jgi:tRNA(Ile)-lysidine synthase TilS/MesJ
MKRGRMYAAARREGYNVLALGQHLDDLVKQL